MASPPWSSPKNTSILVLLQRNLYFVAKTNGSKAPPSWTPPLFALAPFPCREDCPHMAHRWDKEVQAHKISYFVMAMAPTLVRVFWEKNKDLQNFPNDPVSSEARRQGRGGGGHQTVQSALDVVVRGKHRPLSTTVIMPLILPREHEDNMSTGQWWTERDAWAYGGGREWAKMGREEGRAEYETAPALRDN